MPAASRSAARPTATARSRQHRSTPLFGSRSPPAPGSEPAVAQSVDLGASTSVALGSAASVLIPRNAVEDPSDGDRLVLALARSAPGQAPVGSSVPAILPGGFAFAGSVFTVTATWALGNTQVTQYDQPLRISLADTTADRSGRAVPGTAADGASSWRLIPQCARQGVIAAGVRDWLPHLA